MKIISFYSDIEGSTFYSDAAKRMKDNCDKLNIESIIVQRSYGATWLENIQGKPRFIQEMFHELKESFIYADVDSGINSIDFEINGDWGFVMRPMDKMPYDHIHYINFTKHNERALEVWIKRTKERGKCDHSAFITIWENLKYFWIPETHFTIGLGQSKGRTEYLTEAENEAKKCNIS